MSEAIRELVALIRAHHRRLEAVYRSTESALGDEIAQLGKTPVSALIRGESPCIEQQSSQPSS